MDTILVKPKNEKEMELVIEYLKKNNLEFEVIPKNSSKNKKE
jgi:hypothetical protein